MAKNCNEQALAGRLISTRSAILMKDAFYGNLLMHLELQLADCGTACTDMRFIRFDPEFMEHLNEQDLEFVMRHELLHCVLQHPLRGRGLHHRMYNIACDIVVNSAILRAMENPTLFLTDEAIPVMHLAPDGREGADCSAEEIYDMLRLKYGDLPDDLMRQALEKDFGKRLDSHEEWDDMEEETLLAAEWRDILRKECERLDSPEEIPPVIREWLNRDDYQSKIDWRRILHDFLQSSVDYMDYTFHPPDRRFADSEYIFPAFSPVDAESIHDLWLLVDTSGSISDEDLRMVYGEVRSCLDMFPGFQGTISFFDTQVTDPVPLTSVGDLEKILPEGGGGTSFEAIFQYMKDNLSENLPASIVVMTDGWAVCPEEESTMGVPVLWILKDPPFDPPWGISVHIDCD